jgi:hypothetical protein
MSSPPFGSSEYLLRTPPELKQGYKQLEVFSLYPLYSNRTATLQQHCNPLISGTRYLLPCRTATERKLKGAHSYMWRMEATQDHLFLSIARVKRIDGKHQPLRKSGSLLSIPNIVFEPYHYSCDATSVLRFLSYHLCTATVPQQQQSIGIMFRLYQRISVIFPDNVEVLFPGSNRLRKDPGSSRPFWYRQAVSPVDGE